MKEIIKKFSENLGPNFHMVVVWFLTNVFWLIVVIALIVNLAPKVDISQQQDLPNQSQTQQYKSGR